MYKKILTEQALYCGAISMPKGWEIDRDLLANDILQSSFTNKEFPFSKLNGKKVNVLIFPNLDSVNITYKMLKQLHGAESIGPIILGFKRPAHILQLGASVDEIVNMAAVAVVDAQQRQVKNK